MTKKQWTIKLGIIAILFFLMIAGQAWAEPIVWDYSINEYTTLPDCPRTRMLNDEFYALQELYSKPAKFCYWQYRSFVKVDISKPIGRVNDWLMAHRGWKIWRMFRNENGTYDVIVEKQICGEERNR